MSLQVYKNGIVKSDYFFESDASNAYDQISTTTSYTPSTGTNSCITPYRIWTIDFEAGVQIRLKITVKFSGFDSSNANGTFNIFWQGATYTDDSTSVWQGGNIFTNALTNAQSLKDVVLAKTSGTYTYDIVVPITQTFLNSYIGANIGIRSDYSNGTGNIAITDFKAIREELSVSYTGTPKIKMKVRDEWIVTHDYVEL